MPRKGIFWTQGVKAGEDGALYGKGSLSLELVLVDKLGWELDRNPYAVNETLRILLRTLTPIALMLVVCLLTRKDDEAILGRFFARMRTRVKTDPAADQAEMAESLANPDRHDHLLLFPRSNWEFYKWNREDLVGFLVSVAAIFAILGFMHLLLTMGG